MIIDLFDHMIFFEFVYLLDDWCVFVHVLHHIVDGNIVINLYVNYVKMKFLAVLHSYNVQPGREIS